MEQSKLQSLNEASLNVAIGFAVAVLSQVVVFPLVGIHGVSLMTNVHIACYFTVISIVRSYAVRRWFNAWRPMEQSKLQSLFEVGLSVAVGLLVSLLSQVVVFPLVGIHGVSLTTNVHIACYFTVISIVRSYAVRRWFNALQRRQARPDSEGMA